MIGQKGSIMEQDKQNLTTQKKETSIEEKRIEQWKKKEAEINPGFLFKSEGEKDSKVTLEQSFKKENLSEKQKYDLLRATMCAATGSASNDYSLMLFTQALNNIYVKGDQFDGDRFANATLEALLALKPQDEIEGMLISRLLVLHGHYMHCMAVAAISDL